MSALDAFEITHHFGMHRSFPRLEGLAGKATADAVGLWLVGTDRVGVKLSKTSRWATWPGVAHARHDLPAGLVVFLVALPLCLGVALASGVPATSGILAGLIGGIVVGLLSGSELSVSGPAAGLVAIVLAAQEKLGGAGKPGTLGTFGMAVVLSGVMQLGLGFLRAGGVGDFIPNSVIKGMLAAIGMVIVFKQVPHAMGDDRDFEGDESFEQGDKLNTFTEMASALGMANAVAVGITVVSLVILFGWESPWMRRFAWRGVVPPALLCVGLGVGVNEWVRMAAPGMALAAEKGQLVQLPVLGGLEDVGKVIVWPSWGAIGRTDVWVVAVTIALVGSIETLLCIEATDKLDPQRRISDPNRELRAQGLGNVLSGMVGGLPITSVIVRSSANIYSGARTRLSTLLHGAFLLVALLLLGRWLNRIPLAALAAVLIAVGYKLAAPKIWVGMWRQGLPQFLPFAITAMAIVFTDMLKGIGLGLVAGLFFVIRANRHSAMCLVNEGTDWMLRFNKDILFIHKQELKRCLRRVPDGANLVINGTAAQVVDRDIYETLEEFETAARFRGIRVEGHNVAGKERQPAFLKGGSRG